MIGATMQYRSNAALFDSRVARKQRSVLYKTGAGCQKIMRASISRKGTSVPGQPPKAHIKGGGGLKYIRFAVDASQGSVIIGVMRSVPKQPRVLKNRLEWYRSIHPVPKLLNQSGVSQKTTQWHSGAVDDEMLKYRKFPISAYTPTQQKMISFFHKMIASTQL